MIKKIKNKRLCLQGLWWLDEFKNICTNCKINFIGVHAYACNATKIMDQLRMVHQRYHRRVWLTEFACPWSHDPSEQIELLRDLLPQLEAAPWVYRYFHLQLIVKQTFIERS